MNFHDYLNRQNNEDKRAVVIHYPAKSGKTLFARRICETRKDAYLLDLQRYFLDHPELLPIHKCDLTKLQGILLSINVSESVLVVDNPDFLFNTWDEGEKDAFLYWLRVQLRSPVVTEKTMVFIIQDDELLARADFRNSHGEPRVLALNEFDAL